VDLNQDENEIFSRMTPNTNATITTFKGKLLNQPFWLDWTRRFSFIDELRQMQQQG
jgi:hypothetical protein